MKKKGFTLVELLAVIVILAVIALIATPVILNVIETARKGAVEASANNYMEALNQQIMLSEVSGSKLKPNETYNIIKGTEINGVYYVPLNDYVKVKGSKPTGTEDYITLNEKYEIKDARLTIEGYEIKVENGKVVTTEKGEIIELEDIELNSYSETMERGTSYTIVTLFKPNNASEQRLTYESSNNEIVKVDENGLVTAVANGEATVTVIPKGNKEKKKEITIKVISPSEVTGITLNTSEEIIGLGETYSLIATLEPMDATGNALTWTSGNPSVASVSDAGIITGISIGEAVISAETQSGLKAEMKVTVKYAVTLNEEKIYTTDSSVTFENIDITSYTNVSCNNGGVPTYNSNTVTVSNITGNITCSLNTSIAAINNMDNTKNTILMLNDETISETVTIKQDQNIEINLNGKKLEGLFTEEMSVIANRGILYLKDTVGTGIMKSNYVILSSTNTLNIESGNYIRENSSSNKGGGIGILGGNATLKNIKFSTDSTWGIFTTAEDECNLTIENSDVTSNLSSAVVAYNSNSTINISNSSLYGSTGVVSNSGEVNVVDSYINGTTGISVAPTAGKLNIENSKMEGTNYGVYANQAYNENNMINIIDTEIISQNSAAVVNINTGTIIINNSEITSSSPDAAALQNSSSGKMNLINSNVTHTYNEPGAWHQIAVRNEGSGVINIDGGEYKSYASEAVFNCTTGTINIKKGLFYATGLYASTVIHNDATLEDRTGTINICGGTITGESATHTLVDIASSGPYGTINYKSTGINWLNNTNPTLYGESIFQDDTITCEA